MKKIFTLILLGCTMFCISSYAYETSSNIAISAVVPEYNNLPEEARAQLENKIQHMITSCSLGCTAGNRFVMTAKVDILDKAINSVGYFVQKMEITFYLGDVVEDRIYGSCYIEALGVAETENKCFIQAFKNIRPNNPKVREMILQANAEIADYYSNKCDIEIQRAQAKADMGQYEEAIKQLILVPNIDTACFHACHDKILEIYDLMAKEQAAQEAAAQAAAQAAIDREGRVLIQKAKAAWHVKQDYNGAREALNILASIDVDAACIEEANEFIQSISDKLRKDEKAAAAAAAAKAQREWEFKLRQYEDKISMARTSQANRSSILGTLAERFGRIDIGFQKNVTRRWGLAR